MQAFFGRLRADGTCSSCISFRIGVREIKKLAGPRLSAERSLRAPAERSRNEIPAKGPEDPSSFGKSRGQGPESYGRGSPPGARFRSESEFPARLRLPTPRPFGRVSLAGVIPGGQGTHGRLTPSLTETRGMSVRGVLGRQTHSLSQAPGRRYHLKSKRNQSSGGATGPFTDHCGGEVGAVKRREICRFCGFFLIIRLVEVRIIAQRSRKVIRGDEP